MKLNKQIIWPTLDFYALLFFSGLGYLIHYFWLENPAEFEINHHILITSGFGMWVAYVGLNRLLMAEKHLSNTNRIAKILSTISGFTALGLFIVGFCLMISGVDTVNAASGHTPFSPQRIDLLFKLNLGFLIYTSLCFIFIWPRYIVRKNHLTILKSRIYYPGEKYTMWPFLCYQGKVIKDEIDIYPDKSLKLAGKDFACNAEISTSLKLDICRAERMQIRQLDAESFLKKLEPWFVQMITKKCLKITGGQLLTGRVTGKKDLIAGFPIYWDGKFEILARQCNIAE